MSDAMSDAATCPARHAPRRGARSLRRFARRNPTICLGAGIIATMVLLALAAPLIAGDPMVMIPVRPAATAVGGILVRHRQSRPRRVRPHGLRRPHSLAVGLSVAVVSVAGGLVIGLAAGYWRRFDSVVMRLMDGLMAIPSILLAIALVSLTHGGVGIVILAIVIPEVPREVRLVRAVVLSVREQPFVEAAIAGGARAVKSAAPAHPAQHHRAADRAGNLYLRLGDPGRGRAVVPGRRHPAEHPDLGQHDRLLPAVSGARAVDDFRARASASPSWCWR